MFDMLKSNISANDFLCPLLYEKEREFTGRVLLNWLQQWVRDLHHPGLYVRGDGGPGISPVTWRGFQLFPDLAIVEGNTKYLAVEIKLITEVDPGGSMTKAVGQSVLYGQLGYMNSIGMIFDVRSHTKHTQSVRVIQELEISPVTSIFFLGSDESTRELEFIPGL